MRVQTISVSRYVCSADLSDFAKKPSTVACVRRSVSRHARAKTSKHSRIVSVICRKVFSRSVGSGTG